MITIGELERFFIKENEWVESKIISVARSSNFPEIYLNPYDCLDIKSEIWIILSKDKNLNIMDNNKHIEGKINQIVWILLNKSGSSYIRGLNFKNKKVDNYINIEEGNISNDLITDTEEEREFKDIILDKFDELTEKISECGSKEDRILFDLYFKRGMNTVQSLADHLNIPKSSSYSMINYLKYILLYMLRDDLTYIETKKKISDMKSVKFNKKLGILIRVDNNCDCENCTCDICGECEETCGCVSTRDIEEDITIDLDDDDLDDGDEDII